MAKPKVAVIGTGGTISSLSTDPLDSLNYPDAGERLDVRAVLARVPELDRIAEILPVPFRALSSTALTLDDWFDLRDTIKDVAQSHADLDGIVITHGTASLEETAFFLHLTLRSTVPIVIVGAQRPLNALGSDAASNLAAALRVAGSPEARSQGVLVVLNDEIHSARDVVKTSVYRLHSFRSVDQGCLGSVDTDCVSFYRSVAPSRLAASPFAGLPRPAELPRVDILYSYLGADTVFIEAALGAGAAGLVAAAFAPGLVAPSMAQRLEELAGEGFPIVMCSRAHSGRVGARDRLVSSGLIAGEDFSPQKARIILMLSLLEGHDLETVRTSFREL
jgi:L-asparaginase